MLLLQTEQCTTVGIL